MSDGQIVVSDLTKQYRKVRAVDHLSFTVEPGRVTGFLGPNGAGKTTTLRMVLNLVRPSGGTATIGGHRYADLHDPVRHVGAVLEASSAHKGRTGRNHLRIICQAAGIPKERADEVLDLVGLTPAAKRKFRGYSLGMRQRLGIAFALLGDPHVLILDEPANGLDPEGIRWMRDLLKGLASQGRTILVSSHLLSEMEILADDLVIIAATGTPGLRLIRSEFRKIFTTNAWWLFGLGSLGITGLALWGNLAQAASTLNEAKNSTATFEAPPADAHVPPDQLAQMKQEFLAAHDLHAQIIKQAANVYTSGQFLGFMLVLV